ncbi:hypothetical protein D3C72_420070 [compost metagenome]
MIAIFFQQRQALLAIFAHAIQDIDGDRLAGLQGDRLANGQHRVQHRARGVTERPALSDCLRICRMPAAAKKRRAVGFKRGARLTAALYHHHVKQPGTFFIRRTWTSVAQNGVLSGHQFSLDKQFAERRMCQIAVRRCQHHFGVGCQLDGARLATTVQQRYAAQFDIIFRRHNHLSFHIQGAERAPEFRARIGKDHFVAAVRIAHRLPGIAPDFTRLQIADIAERTPVIAGGIAAPAGEGQIVPAAVTAASVGHHQMVMTV